MAASLKIASMVFCGSLCLVSAAYATEQFVDPTRPSIELVPGIGQSASDDAAPVPPPSGLQSVIISPKRKAAIINGSGIEIGERFGDAVLTVVNENCVVLVGPAGRRVIHMFPTVSLSKDELMCVKRGGLQSVSKAQAEQAARPRAKEKRASAKKKPRAKKRAIVCAPEEIKDGSNK